MSRHQPSPCQRCAGPKPAGIGRRLCDACLTARAEEVKAARKEYQRRRYLANRDDVLARERARRGDPEFRKQKREYMARWRDNDPEKARLIARRTRIKGKYGLTLEEYDAILARGCAICGSRKGRVVGKRNGWEPPPPRLCLDHNHTDGAIRDALCHSCNSGLGLFSDDPGRMRAAADYLEKHRAT